ncbi:MAG: hypothetical protein CMK09_04330 [Ponticaulis sp.]|mgnify:CR=1 FL=1|nr:hypothetical protein [Ponticaulis sp.]|tara:strand:+ start:8382 stop:8789 length:408 start_codon:yes stop_codon:yes gene_type:complete
MAFSFEAQKPPASDEALGELTDTFGHILPESYLALLKYSNGGEWSLAVEPFDFVLFEVPIVIGNLRGTDFTEVFPDCLPIGGDGMTEYIALDFSIKPARVVAIDATEDDPETAIYPVSASIEEFISLIGTEPEES